MDAVRLCECGCGEPAPVAQRTDSSRGYVKGKPHRWRQGHGPKALHLPSRRVPFAVRFSQKVICHGDPDACWPWVGPGGTYGHTSISGRNSGAHVESYKFFKGEPTPGLVVRHTCDQPRCCNPRHLLIGTAMDNTRDMIERGRQVIPHGERNGNSVLNAEQVMAVRASAAAGRTARELSQDYGVHANTVYKILSGRSWRHV